MDIQPTIISGSNAQQSLELARSLIFQASPDLNEENIIRVAPSPASIGIDQIKAIVAGAPFSTLSGNFKAYIIESAEVLTEEAQNALLKILEEPPPDTLFVLTTSNIDLIFPTITSRCRIIEAVQSPQKDTAGLDEIEKILQLEPAGRLPLSVEKENAQTFITKTQILLQKLLKTSQKNNEKELTLTVLKALRTTEVSRQMIEANVAKDAVLELLILSLPTIDKSYFHKV